MSSCGGDDSGSGGDDTSTGGKDASGGMDACGTVITGGTPPFTGCFKPEQALSGFNGQAAKGSWALVIGDDSAGDAGTVNSWELSLCVAP